MRVLLQVLRLPLIELLAMIGLIDKAENHAIA